MKSFISQTVAQLAQFASRRKYAIVEYDDTYKEYFSDFRWAAFQDALRIKLDEFGIGFKSNSASAHEVKDP